MKNYYKIEWIEFIVLSEWMIEFDIDGIREDVDVEGLLLLLCLLIIGAQTDLWNNQLENIINNNK